MIKKYLQPVYLRAVEKAYALSLNEIRASLSNGGQCLDCGADAGYLFNELNMSSDDYYGIEWQRSAVECARKANLNVLEGDLNKELEFEDEKFQCVFGLSVLEHLLFPCLWLQEAMRVLKYEGKLVILTPNISTFFTIALLLVGKMPSSGPHPDSAALVAGEEIVSVKDMYEKKIEGDTPAHRHLIIFSYKVLSRYLKLLGFKDVKGFGFGLYPFPKFMQPLLEKIDPYHCHQLVFVATK